MSLHVGEQVPDERPGRGADPRPDAEVAGRVLKASAGSTAPDRMKKMELRAEEGHSGCGADSMGSFSKIVVGILWHPETIITDGGAEFEGWFAEAAAAEGIFLAQHWCNAESPWENGRAERHGGLVKDLLEKGIGEHIVYDLRSLQELSNATIDAKNRSLNRGGFSPSQLVFGVNPATPAELFSDQAIDEPGWQSSNQSPGDFETPAGVYRQATEIRKKAWTLLMREDAAAKLRRAA